MDDNSNSSDSSGNYGIQISALKDGNMMSREGIEIEKRKAEGDSILIGYANFLEGIDIFYQIKQNKEKLFRIIRYDIHNHKLIAVHQLSGTEREKLEPELNAACKNLNLTIGLDGKVTLEKKFDPQKYIVRATVSIKVHDDIEKKFSSLYGLFHPTPNSTTEDQRYKAIYRTKTVTDWKDVQEKLKEWGGKKMSSSEGDFPITLFPPSQNSNDTISNIDNKFKGIIGETVTELTILSLGYTQMISKFSGDHGLDGIFTEPIKNTFIITESKCESPGSSAETTLKNELNEHQVYIRIQNGIKNQNTKKSMQNLHAKITDRQDGVSVLKLAHRTHHSEGKTQGHSMLLNSQQYIIVSEIDKNGKLSNESLTAALAKLSNDDLNGVIGILPREKQIEIINALLASKDDIPEVFERKIKVENNQSKAVMMNHNRNGQINGPLPNSGPDMPPVSSIKRQLGHGAANILMSDSQHLPIQPPLSDLLGQMDEYTPTIPDDVMKYYLSTAGYETADPRVLRLVSLAAQKFVSDIGTEAMQNCQMRGAIAQASESKDCKFVMTTDDLTQALKEKGITVKKPP